MGLVGRFGTADGVLHPRRCRVIVRTTRGLEVGEVLTLSGESGDIDGPLLRRVTVQDELLIQRIERRKDEAYTACVQLLEKRGIGAILMDVEHLFDGQSLFFYFLGDVTPELEALTAELADVYEAKVQFRRFTETLTAGCGPDCGTENSTGCATGGCSSCALTATCARPAR
jgi:cell fate regulator YaaT (PSP1 superfamily)